MWWIERAQRAGRIRADHAQGIGAARRTRRQTARRIQLDVGRQVGGQGDQRPGGLAFFQRELVGRRVQLAEVVDAGIGLRSGAGVHEVRNRNGCEQADDGHNDHDFDEREPHLADVIGLFHCVCFLFWRREQTNRRVI